MSNNCSVKHIALGKKVYFIDKDDTSVILCKRCDGAGFNYGDYDKKIKCEKCGGTGVKRVIPHVNLLGPAITEEVSISKTYGDINYTTLYTLNYRGQPYTVSAELVSESKDALHRKLKTS